MEKKTSDDSKNKDIPIILGVSGASGVYASHLFVNRSPFPVDVIMSRWAKDIDKRECNGLDFRREKIRRWYDNDDLAEPPSSGSVPTVGMVILPCSVNTLAKIAVGITDNLITRAAHCHLKERRPLVLCIREAPLTLIDLKNSLRVAEAGGVIMPLSPPFYMQGATCPEEVRLADMLNAYVDRILSLFGHSTSVTWENIR